MGRRRPHSPHSPRFGDDWGCLLARGATPILSASELREALADFIGVGRRRSWSAMAPTN